jgi:hypothetical protein
VVTDAKDVLSLEHSGLVADFSSSLLQTGFHMPCFLRPAAGSLGICYLASTSESIASETRVDINVLTWQPRTHLPTLSF